MATFNNLRVIMIILFALVLMRELHSSSSRMMGYSNVSCIESERKALTEFRRSLVDKTHRLSSWVGADCCKWHGVGCSKITGRVVKLDLRNPVMLNDMLVVMTYENYSRAQLAGKIPTGYQLQTLDDPSIYMGNKELCGAPLLNDCPGDNKSSGSHERLDDDKGDEDASDQLWFYAGVGPGFLVGFLGVCGILHFNNSWRYAFFRLIESMYNWIVVAIAVKLALLRRKFHRAQLGRSN